jgi:hypothetical protein
VRPYVIFVLAARADTRFFSFPGTHAATQSSFNQGPYVLSSDLCAHFKSDFMTAIRVTVDQNQQQYPTLEVTVKDNQPIFIYNSADNDC